MSETSERLKANRAYYVSVGRCKYCGQQDARTLIGKTQCFDCKEKARVRGLAAYPRYRERHNQKTRDRYEARKAAGLFPTCGNALPKNSRWVTCQTCRKKKAARQLDRWHAAGHLSKEEIMERGGCANCGRPVRQGENSAGMPIKLCPSCYEKSLHSMALARLARKEMGPNTWQEYHKVVMQYVRKLL